MFSVAGRGTTTTTTFAALIATTTTQTTATTITASVAPALLHCRNLYIYGYAERVLNGVQIRPCVRAVLTEYMNYTASASRINPKVEAVFLSIMKVLCTKV